MPNIQSLSYPFTAQQIIDKLNEIIEVLYACKCPCDDDLKCFSCGQLLDAAYVINPKGKTCAEVFGNNYADIHKVKCPDGNYYCECPNPPPTPCESLRCDPPNIKVSFRIFNRYSGDKDYIDDFANLVNDMGGRSCCNNATTMSNWEQCSQTGSDSYVNACVSHPIIAQQICDVWQAMGSSGTPSFWDLSQSWTHPQGFMCQCSG